MNRSAIYWPDYLHDYNLDNLAFRYNYTGIYRNQVKLDGRTVIVAKVPTHSKIITSLLAPSVREKIWQKTSTTGFVATDSKCHKSTCWSVPNTFDLSKLGLNNVYAKLETASSNISDNIYYIDLASRRRIAFMQSFESKFAHVLGVVLVWCSIISDE